LPLTGNGGLGFDSGFGGIVVDKLGTAIALIIFLSITTIGHLLFAIACQVSSFPFMLVARIIYGIGGESLIVAATASLAFYFKDKELSLAVGSQISIARLGSVLNTYCAYQFYVDGHNSIPFAMYIGVILLVFSFVLNIIPAVVEYAQKRKNNYSTDMKTHYDQHANTQDDDIAEDEEDEEDDNDSTDNKNNDVNKTKIPTDDTNNNNKITNDGNNSNTISSNNINSNNDTGNIVNNNNNSNNSNNVVKINTTNKTDNDDDNETIHRVHSIHYLHHVHHVHNIHHVRKKHDLHNTEKNSTAKQGISLEHIKHFDKMFWIICVGAFMFYGSIVSWFHIGSLFIQHAFKHDAQTANSELLIPFAMAIGLVPFCGFLADKFGYRSYTALIAAASVVLTYAFWLFCVETISVIVGLVLLGIGYSVYTAVLWPVFPLMIESEMIGTAYGIIAVFYNTAYSIIPIFIGVLQGYDDVRFFYVNLMFFIFCSITLICVVLLVIFDKNKILLKSKLQHN